MTTTRTFDEIVESYPVPVKGPAADARRVIRRLLPKAGETVELIEEGDAAWHKRPGNCKP